MPDEDKPPDSGQQQIGLMLLAEDHGLTYTGKLETCTAYNNYQFKSLIHFAVKLRIIKSLNAWFQFIIS